MRFLLLGKKTNSSFILIQDDVRMHHFRLSITENDCYCDDFFCTFDSETVHIGTKKIEKEVKWFQNEIIV